MKCMHEAIETLGERGQRGDGEKLGSISRKIVDPDGDPMAGVSVTASRAGTTEQGGGGSGVTNDLGEYCMDGAR